MLRDIDALPYGRSGRRPTKSTLVSRDAVGEVPAGLWRELCDDPFLVPRLVQMVLYSQWPESLHPAIIEHFGLDMSPMGANEQDINRRFTAVLRAQRNPDFRVEVLKAYGKRCAVCGYDARLGECCFGLEAAHIRWHAFGGPDEVTNGLALCTLHHIAFDRGAIGIDSSRRLLISQDVAGGDTVERALLDFSGAPLLGPQDRAFVPTAESLAWHRNEVFRQPARRF